MTVDQVARRGYEADYRLRLREFADRHYDVLSFFPALAVAVLLVACLIVGAL